MGCSRAITAARRLDLPRPDGSRALALAVLAIVAAAACGSSVTDPTTSPHLRALQACDDASEPRPSNDGQGGPAAPGDGGAVGAPSAAHRYCLQITIPRSAAREQIVQVVVLSNQSADPLRDRTVLVYHPGGPGLSAVKAMLEDPPPVDLDTYALLTWDGTTSGNAPGACGPESISYFTERTPNDFAMGAVQAGEECLGGFGGADDLGAWAAAEEVESIREALGLERFDFLTHSYGTAIAEAYLVVHPDRVRRAVLDAPVGLDVPWAVRLQTVGKALEEGSDQLARACDTVACDAALGDAPAGLSYETLRDAVIRRNPAVGSGKLKLTPIMFDQAASLALRSQANWSGFGDAVDEALGGDGSSLFRVAERMYLDVDRSVFYQSLCADIDRPPEPALYVFGDDPLQFAFGSELAPCSRFPRGVPRKATSAPGEPPDVLVVASRNDVLAPASMAKSARFLQSIAPLCETTVAGHTSFGDPAIRKLIFDFLTSGDATAVATRCLN